jgi:hypothetical protein
MQILVKQFHSTGTVVTKKSIVNCHKSQLIVTSISVINLQLQCLLVGSRVSVTGALDFFFFVEQVLWVYCSISASKPVLVLLCAFTRDALTLTFEFFTYSELSSIVSISSRTSYWKQSEPGVDQRR